MKVCSVVARVLAGSGVDTLFGMLGDANLFIVDALVREHDVRYVSASREDGAVLMADGYARVSGRLGIASVTQGPGLTNTLTALIEGGRAATPMVVVVGDTPADADQHLQDVDQREVVACSGAGFVQVRSAALAAKDTATAVRRAWAERRPIVLNIPTDIQRLDVDPPEMHSTEPQRPTVVPDPAQLDRAVGLIYSARRPIIVAGRGAVMSEARTALLELGALIGAPVATTLGAKDYFGGDRWNLGLFGTLSTDVATSIIADCDCVIFFGAGVNRFTASDGAFLEKKRVIQVDVDPRSLGSTTRST